MTRLPKIEGATLFSEEDLDWGLAIQRHAVVVLFSRPVERLSLLPKRAAFFCKGLRWLSGGCSLYSGQDTTAPDVGGDEGGNDPGHVELGFKLERENGAVVLNFGRAVKRVTWTAASAEYAANRIDTERKAIV